MNCNDTPGFNETCNANRAMYNQHSSDRMSEVWRCVWGSLVPLSLLCGKYECIVGVRNRRTGHMRAHMTLLRLMANPGSLKHFVNDLQHIPDSAFEKLGRTPWIQLKCWPQKATLVIFKREMCQSLVEGCQAVTCFLLTAWPSFHTT